jgi:hypothetical protein
VNVIWLALGFVVWMIFLVLQIAFPKGIMWGFFGLMDGIVLLIGVASDGGIDYTSGTTTMTVGIQGLSLFFLIIPVVATALLMIRNATSD